MGYAKSLYMKQIINVILLLGAVCLTSCQEVYLRAQLKQMIGTTVILPEKISCVYNGEIIPMEDSLRTMPKLFVFVDSTECSTCKISEFIRYEEVFSLAHTVGSFVPLIFLTTKKDDYEAIVEHLSLIELFCPVFLDDEFIFRTLNRTIPDDSRFHTFFMDENNRICVIGDPSIKRDLVDIFQSHIN